jgi:hypothetical protein
MTSVDPGSGLGDSHPAPEPRPPALVERILSPEWGPIVAGGIAPAALALALHAFAVGIGLCPNRGTRTAWEGLPRAAA